MDITTKQCKLQTLFSTLPAYLHHLTYNNIKESVMVSLSMNCELAGSDNDS